MNKKEKILATCICLGTFFGCVPSDHKAKALDGVSRFHQYFNNNEFSRMYDDLDEEGRAGTSLQQFIEEMTAIRKGQGAVLKSTELTTEYHYMDGVSKVRVIVSVAFEKGEAREEFVFSITKGDTKLSGYRFLGP